MYNRVLFIGSKKAGFKVLKKMYYTAPDKLSGCVTVDDSLDSRSELEAIKSFCNKKGIQIDILTGKCDLTESIDKYEPDICFVMGWYYIIDEKLIEQVRGGFVGIHNSLLPLHRGFAPVVWAMISGDTETGVTVFSFDKGMDTGAIWYQQKVAIDTDDYINDVLAKIDEKISCFFDDFYIGILSERIHPTKQKLDNISYGAKRTPEDGIIDWSKNADDIYNFIRAQSKPYPGAFTYYKGERVVIWKSKIFPFMIQGNPGQIGLIDSVNKSVIVVCGNDTGIILESIEKEGKEISVMDEVKSLKYKMGE
jgi:methionyl-tRNA formyltransferase